jgi:hypothetical protein
LRIEGWYILRSTIHKCWNIELLCFVVCLVNEIWTKSIGLKRSIISVNKYVIVKCFQDSWLVGSIVGNVWVIFVCQVPIVLLRQVWSNHWWLNAIRRGLN